MEIERVEPEIRINREKFAYKLIKNINVYNMFKKVRDT